MNDQTNTDQPNTVRTDSAVPAPASVSASRWERHRFDPVSAVLAVVAVLGGALVVSGATEPFSSDDVGVWVIVAAIIIGLAVLPWSPRSAPSTAQR